MLSLSLESVEGNEFSQAAGEFVSILSDLLEQLGVFGGSVEAVEGLVSEVMSVCRQKVWSGMRVNLRMRRYQSQSSVQSVREAVVGFGRCVVKSV